VFCSIMSVTTWEVLADNFLVTEERSFILDQKTPTELEIKKEQEKPEPQPLTEKKQEPESQPIKEEQDELWIFQNERQLVVKQETNTFMGASAYVEIFNNGPELQQMTGIKEEPDPVQIKEQQEELEPDQMKEELRSNQDEDHLVAKQEKDGF
ncbi:hypothetical protein CRENBAI_008551, partial [Crenichthys baileyi]